jgi:hypothetical protein
MRCIFNAEEDVEAACVLSEIATTPKRGYALTYLHDAGYELLRTITFSGLG